MACFVCVFERKVNGREPINSALWGFGLSTDCLCDAPQTDFLNHRKHKEDSNTIECCGLLLCLKNDLSRKKIDYFDNQYCLFA